LGGDDDTIYNGAGFVLAETWVQYPPQLPKQENPA
jgi:hypothetical protein